MEVGIRQAKARLSKLIEAAVSGERIIITNHAKPLAEIIQIRRKLTKAGSGVRHDEESFEGFTAGLEIVGARRRICEIV